MQIANSDIFPGCHRRERTPGASSLYTHQIKHHLML